MTKTTMSHLTDTESRRLTHGEMLELRRWNTPTVYNGWEQITRHNAGRDGFNIEETVDYMPQTGALVSSPAWTTFLVLTMTSTKAAVKRYTHPGGVPKRSLHRFPAYQLTARCYCYSRRFVMSDSTHGV